MNESNHKKISHIVILAVILYCVIQKYQLVLAGISYLFHLIFPFVLGGCIAFVINVPMSAIEDKLLPNQRKFDSFRRICAYILTLLLIGGILGLSMFVIIPQISDTIKQIALLIPPAVVRLQNRFSFVMEYIPNAQNYITETDIDWTKVSSNLVSFVKNAGGDFFSSGISVVSSIIGGIATGLIAFIFSIYVIFQKEALGRQVKKVLFAIFPEKKADRWIEIGQLTNRVFRNFLSGQCIEAVILGFMFFITLTIFRLPYALLIGVVIAISALIPIFGAFIGLVVGALLIIMVDPVQALWFVIIFFVLQQIEGNVIYPKVVGSSVGLPSIWVLVAVSVGGSLLGIAGILLFIPLCSVLYSLFRDWVNHRLAAKQITSSKWSDKEPAIQKQNEPQKNKKKKEDTNKSKNTTKR